jgi:hypothetical protein
MSSGGREHEQELAQLLREVREIRKTIDELKAAEGRRGELPPDYAVLVRSHAELPPNYEVLVRPQLQTPSYEVLVRPVTRPEEPTIAEQ